jgi:hypothetical protein
MLLMVGCVIDEPLDSRLGDQIPNLGRIFPIFSTLPVNALSLYIIMRANTSIIVQFF